MSQESTRTALLDAILNSEYQVMVLTGGWGTGKSYLWERCIDEKVVKELRPIYISAFGHITLDSLQHELSISIIESDDKVDGGESANSSGWMPKWSLRNKSTLEVAGKVASNYLPGLDEVLNLGRDALLSRAMRKIGGRLIVVDDIERASHIPVDALLGFIHGLTEQRQARVLLILNDSELDEGSRKHWDRLREKTFDIEIGLTISKEEAVDAGMTAHPLAAKVRDVITRLGVTNIRTIRQIDREVRRIFLMYNLDQERQASLIPSTVLFFALKLKAISGGPSAEWVLKNALTGYYGLKDEGANPDEVRWAKWSKEMKWGYPDSYESEILLPYLVSGHLNRDKLSAYLEEQSERLSRQEADLAVNEFWSSFNWHTVLSERELHEMLKKLPEKAGKLSGLHASQLANLASEHFFDKELGSEFTSAWIRLNDNLDVSEDFDWRNRAKLHPLIEAEINRQRAKKYPVPSLVEAVIHIAVQRGWGNLQIQAISNASVHDVAGALIGMNPEQRKIFVLESMKFVCDEPVGADFSGFVTNFIAAAKLIIADPAQARLAKLLTALFEERNKADLLRHN